MQVEVKYDGDRIGSAFDCNTWISKTSGLMKTFLGTVISSCGSYGELCKMGLKFKEIKETN